MRKILVVNVNWLGDCVMTLPVFEALKDKYPHSYVAVMATIRLKGLFEHNSYIDEVIEFDERTAQSSLNSKIAFVAALRKKKFDTAFFIHRSFTRILICFLAGIRERVGYKRSKTFFILNSKIKAPCINSVHRSEYYFHLFKASGIMIKNSIPEISVTEREKKYAAALLREYKNKYKYMVAVNPSSNWILKRWSKDNFALLVNKLNEIGCAVFLIGTKSDKPVADEVESKSGKIALNLAGKTTLRELAAVLGQMDLIVSSDSGPAHLAAALGIDTIILFGPTSPAITAPKGNKVHIFKKDIPCQIPCYKLDCEDNQCMALITPDEVFIESEKILTGNG